MCCLATSCAFAADAAIWQGRDSKLTLCRCVLLAAPEAPSLRHEYGTLEVTVDLVEDMSEAIDKIHAMGSGHTEACHNSIVCCHALATVCSCHSTGLWICKAVANGAVYCCSVASML